MPEKIALNMDQFAGSGSRTIRWRNEYGGLKGDQVKRLKELEIENSRLVCLFAPCCRRTREPGGSFVPNSF